MIADPGSGPPPGMKKYLMVAITYLSCAAFHASREGFVAVKANFQSHMRFPTQLLGYMDTTFLVFYGTGLLFSGSVGARYGNKFVAGVGLTGTALIIATLGALTKGWILPLPENADEAWMQGTRLYLPLWALNGMIQSLGFPNLVAVTSGWVDPTQRGLILGLWSTTGAAGDIIGLNVATYVLEGGGGTDNWPTVFFVVAIYLTITAALLGFLVEDVSAANAKAKISASEGEGGNGGETAPLLKGGAAGGNNGATRDAEAGAAAGDGDGDGANGKGGGGAGATNIFSGFVEAFAIPGVLDWSLSYFFIKTVTYTILFWMPYYLTLTLDSVAAADNLTVIFDVAMIIGTATLGSATDAFGGTRSPVFVASFVIGSLPLLFLPVLQESIPHYAAAFAMVGVFTGGPAHMYGTAVSVDLGEAAAAMGKPGLVSSLSGLIDGIGTLGAAVGQSLVARVASEGERSRAYLSEVIAKEPLRSSDNETDASGGGGSKKKSKSGGSSSILVELSQADVADAASSRDGGGDEVVAAADALAGADAADGDGDYDGDNSTSAKEEPVDEEEEAVKKLYTDTEEHHAGGEKRGLAKIVTTVTEAVTEQVSSGVSAALAGQDPIGSVDAASATTIAALAHASDKVYGMTKKGAAELGRYRQYWTGAAQLGTGENQDTVVGEYMLAESGDGAGGAADAGGGGYQQRAALGAGYGGHHRYYSSYQEYAALGVARSSYSGRWSGGFPAVHGVASLAAGAGASSYGGVWWPSSSFSSASLGQAAVAAAGEALALGADGAGGGGGGGNHTAAASGSSSGAVAMVVDAEFRERWSRVFLMLFCFNLAAAVALLRVAYRELRKIGFFGGNNGAGGGGADDNANEAAVKSPSKKDEIPP